MARTVHCTKLGVEAEGLEFLPYPGELGKKVWANISKEAWQQWLQHQTMLINDVRQNVRVVNREPCCAREISGRSERAGNQQDRQQQNRFDIVARSA